MKKVLCLVLLILLTGCGNKLTTYKEINYKELENKLDNKESFVLFIGSSTCSHCKAFKTTIDSVIKKYQVEVFYIDVYELSEDEKNAMNSKIQFKYTPTTIFIEKGVASSAINKRIVGESSYDKVVKKFKSNGYIGG